MSTFPKINGFTRGAFNSGKTMPHYAKFSKDHIGHEMHLQEEVVCEYSQALKTWIKQALSFRHDLYTGIYGTQCKIFHLTSEVSCLPENVLESTRSLLF